MYIYMYVLQNYGCFCTQIDTDLNKLQNCETF